MRSSSRCTENFAAEPSGILRDAGLSVEDLRRLLS